MPDQSRKEQNGLGNTSVPVRLYAHSLKDQPLETWQPLHPHLKQVSTLAAEFCDDFGSTDWGWNAAMLHDVGKASRVFQAYLRRENQSYIGTVDMNYVAEGELI